MPQSPKIDADSILSLARLLTNVPWSPEYEQMVTGKPFFSESPPIRAARHRTSRLVHRYNNSFPPPPPPPDLDNDDDISPDELEAQRHCMLCGIVGHLGADVVVVPPATVSFGFNTSLGDGTWINSNVTIMDSSLVTLGKRVLVGPNVSFITATHDVEVAPRRADEEFALPIVVGDDCWIGAIILPGVNVGKGCTVGAGSVVREDVPDWSVVVGVPARVVKTVEPVDDE